MNKEIILIPKDKDIVDYIKEMVEVGRLESGWLFVHNNIYKELIKAEKIRFKASNWMAGDTWLFLDHFCLISSQQNTVGTRYNVFNYVERVEDPENIFFLKMEE